MYHRMGAACIIKWELHIGSKYEVVDDIIMLHKMISHYTSWCVYCCDKLSCVALAWEHRLWISVLYSTLALMIQQHTRQVICPTVQ